MIIFPADSSFPVVSSHLMAKAVALAILDDYWLQGSSRDQTKFDRLSAIGEKDTGVTTKIKVMMMMMIIVILFFMYLLSLIDLLTSKIYLDFSVLTKICKVILWN